MNKEIKIRFNTNCSNNIHFWRVLIDEKEFLVSNIKINVPSFTTKNYIEGIGDKWHISCFYNQLIWEENDSLIIN